MNFGIFLSHERIYEPGHYDLDLYEEKMVEAKLADRLGYELLWLPEHHFIHFMQAPNPLMLAAHYGQQVSCRVGVMVSVLPYRNPLITAGEIALADRLLGGRFELGVGRGAYKYEFERLGIPFEEGKERFAEALEVLEQLWHAEEATGFDGDFTSFEPTYVWPRPAQQPHPPVWVAGMSPPTVAQAVKDGYHVTNWPFLRPMSAVETIASTFRDACAEREDGGEGLRLGILRGAYVAPTSEQAREQVDAALVNHRVNQRLHHFTQNADATGVVAPEVLEDEPTPDEIYENLIMGTPEECIAKVEAYAELGVTDLLLNFDYGPDHADVVSAMTLFADEVIAPYRERTAARGAAAA